jgi:hypothetical protein
MNIQIRRSVTIPKSKIRRWVAAFRGASDGAWLQALHLQDVLEGLPLNSALRQVGDGVGAPVALEYIYHEHIDGWMGQVSMHWTDLIGVLVSVRLDMT